MRVTRRQVLGGEGRVETLELSLANQSALDTFLAQADRSVQHWFAALLIERAAVK
ncbi:hypothetical protein [Streptomyces sp. NPDC059788]|uniref:hypothetical protein n=1 Tax=Streptomyces sp. NPDC059788 TaxID=3346948 RepID=UPI00364EC6D6